MDDSKIKRTYDMDDVKNSNRMDLDNYGEKMDPKKGIKEKNNNNNSNNNVNKGNQQNLNPKNKDELLNISESS